MAILTPTLTKATEFAGKCKLLVLDVVPTTASDTVTLTAATHGVRVIDGVFGNITEGQDAALVGVFPTFSGLVITVTTTAAAGTAATDWTGAKVRLLVIAH